MICELVYQPLEHIRDYNIRHLFALYVTLTCVYYDIYIVYMFCWFEYIYAHIIGIENELLLIKANWRIYIHMLYSFNFMFQNNLQT